MHSSPLVIFSINRTVRNLRLCRLSSSPKPDGKGRGRRAARVAGSLLAWGPFLLRLSWMILNGCAGLLAAIPFSPPGGVVRTRCDRPGRRSVPGRWPSRTPGAGRACVAELAVNRSHASIPMRGCPHASIVNMQRSVQCNMTSLWRLWMISPYVRRLRLAAALRALGAEAGLTHEQLAERIGESRAQISGLENGHIVDQADVMKILDALGVDGERWTQIVTIAREAGEKGWWESTRGMGERQPLYANLEAGAPSIREYSQTFLPAPLQNPGFVRARLAADATLKPRSTSPDGGLAGNAGRQRVLRPPGAPTYQGLPD